MKSRVDNWTIYLKEEDIKICPQNKYNLTKGVFLENFYAKGCMAANQYKKAYMENTDKRNQVS